MRDLQFCLANFYHRTLFSLTLQHIEQTISLLCFATVGISSPWLMLMLVSDSSIIREEVVSPGRSYSSRYFVEYIRKIPFPFFSPPPPPSFVRIFTFSHSLVLSVDIQRASALIEVMFWLQIVLIRRRSRTQLLFHLGRRNWLKNESNALRSLVTRPPAKRMNRVRFRNYRYGKGKSPREESAENFCQVKSSLRKQTTLQKDPNGNGDWKTHDETNRSWPQKDHRKIRQSRYRVLWRSLRRKKERVLVVSISVK